LIALSTPRAGADFLLHHLRQLNLHLEFVGVVAQRPAARRPDLQWTSFPARLPEVAGRFFLKNWLNTG
jgi:hypothetical protein